MKKSYFFKFFVFALVGALVILPSCKDYDDDISRLDQELSNLKTELTSQLTAIKAEMNTAIDAKIKTVTDELNAAKTKLTTLETQVQQLETNGASKEELNALKDQIEEVKTEILEKTVAIETYNAFRAAIEDDLAALTTRVTALENGSATKAELAALEAEITVELGAIIEQLDELDVRVKALEDSYEALLAKHDEDIQDLITKLAELKAELDPRIITIEVLLDIVDGKSTVLDGIDTDLTEQLALIEANKTAIEDLAEDLAAKYAALEAADEDLQKQITDNYNELDSKITVNKDAIDALTLRVDAIEEEIEVIKDSITALEEDLNIKIGSLFTLAKNRLTSITLAPNAYLDGIEALKFTTLKYRPMEAGENTGVSTDYNMSIGAPALASYKFNPRTFVLGNADYGYVNRTAEILTRATSTNIVEIVGEPVYKAADGTVNFTLRRLNAHSTQPTGNKENFIALEATLKGAALAEGETGVVVAAPQELVYDELITPFDLFISDKATLATAGDSAHYPVTFDEAAASTKIWYEIPYDKVYDLLAKVATCDVTDDDHKAFNIADYNLTYKFSVASTAYNVLEGSTVTNQQDWVELVSSEDGTYKAKGFNNELIGRTPILKVELVDQANNVVRRAFVKVKFVAEKTPDITVGESHTLVYNCNNTAAQFEITEQYIRDNVYRVITSGKQTSMSHEEFWNLYDAATATTKVTKNGSNYTMTSVPQIVDGATGVGTATKKITWSFNHGELGQIEVNGSQFVASVTVKNKLTSSEFPEYVTFQFTVNVTLPNVNLPAANKVENDQYWSKNADGSYYAYKVNVAVPAATNSSAADAIFKTSLPQAYSKYIVNTAGACTTDFYKVVATYSNGSKTASPLAGVQISGTDITLDKTNAAVKTALNSAGGLQASVAHIYKLENGEEITVNTFLVDFIRPVNLNMPSGITVKDAKTGGDVADFQWNGILTDWRGEFIVDGSWVDVDTDESFWANTYQPEYTWKDGHYVEVTPASLDVVMEDASFTIGSTPIELFEGTATYQRQEWGHISGLTFGWKNVGAPVVFESEQMLTEDQVNTWLAFKLTELESSWNFPILKQVVVVSAPDVTSEMVSTPGQVVEYSYVKSVTYTPAVYDWVPGEWVEAPHTPTDMPTVDGTHNGQVIGDWTWTVVITSDQVWAPGQYWDFYGPFSSIVANIAGVTTNLTYNGGQLPADVTLEQIGNTVKYVNVGTPVGYSYEIYIPVSVNYGWGTLSTTLTIKVIPAN